METIILFDPMTDEILERIDDATNVTINPATHSIEFNGGSVGGVHTAFLILSNIKLDPELTHVPDDLFFQDRSIDFLKIDEIEILKIRIQELEQRIRKLERV
jgi:hypothetical protein